MKKEHIHLVAARIETCVFLWIGILLIGMVKCNITRFFVAHRLKPFIAGAGCFFLLWGVQNILIFSSPDRKRQSIPHQDSGYFIHEAVFLILVFFISIPVIRYLEPGITQKKFISAVASDGTISQTQLNSQIKRYSDSQFQTIESPLNSGTSGILYQKTVRHSLTTSADQLLSGYYPEKKQIVISDTEGAGWVKEIENHTSSYIGWSVKMKGKIVTDPSVFAPGMFCPSRELMTCCVADLSLIGFTCIYDIHGPFAQFIRDGSWVMVTGTVKQGDYQGQPEPQLVCTAVEETAPPEDEYLYPQF
jgi:uncharacterized repeat protein (TIGR03943 family)